MKKKVCIVLLSIAVLMCSIFAIGCEQKAEPMLGITKIVGIQDATVEVGTYYEVPQNVYGEDANGKKWSLDCKVTFDGKPIDIDEFSRLKISKAGDYLITYVFDAKGYNKFEKVITIKGVDSLAPIIKFNSAPTLKLNKEFDFSTLDIYAKDNSLAELEVAFSLFYGDKDVTNSIVNKKFTPTKNGIYYLKATACDAGNLSATASLTLEVKKENELESFDNDAFYLAETNGKANVEFDNYFTKVSHNSSKEFILEGDGSVRITSQFDSDGWPETHFNNLSTCENDVYSISFYVYNNGSKSARLSLMNKSGKFATDLSPKLWNKVELLAEDFAEAGLIKDNKIDLSKFFFWVQQAGANQEKFDVFVDGLALNAVKPQDITFSVSNKGLNSVGDTVTINSATFVDNATLDYSIVKPNGEKIDLNTSKDVLMDIDGTYLLTVKADNKLGKFSYYTEKLECLNLSGVKRIKKINDATINGDGETPILGKELITDANYLVSPNKNAIKLTQTAEQAKSNRPWFMMAEVLNNDITNYSYVEYVLWADGVGDKDLELQPNGIEASQKINLKDGWNRIRINSEDFAHFGIIATNMAQKNGTEGAYISIANHDNIPFTVILSEFYAGGYAEPVVKERVDIYNFNTADVAHYDYTKGRSTITVDTDSRFLVGDRAKSIKHSCTVEQAAQGNNNHVWIAFKPKSLAIYDVRPFEYVEVTIFITAENDEKIDAQFGGTGLVKKLKLGKNVVRIAKADYTAAFGDASNINGAATGDVGWVIMILNHNRVAMEINISAIEGVVLL